MEPKGLWPWDLVVTCGVLAVAAYVMGSMSHSEEKPQVQTTERPDVARDAEVDRLRVEQENNLREAAAQFQKLTLELQTLEASRKLEKQALEEQQTALQRKLLDAEAKLRSEEEAYNSLEEKLRETKDKMRDLEQDYNALKRRFEEELSSLRIGFQNAASSGPSPRVLAQRMRSGDVRSPREARVEEWRRRFQRGQEARDAYHAWLEKEREGDFLWATSLVHLEDGGRIDWPTLLLEPGFLSYRNQAELAVRTRNLKQLNTAASGALHLLERRAKEYGQSTESYLAAKRFLNVLKDLAI